MLITAIDIATEIYLPKHMHMHIRGRFVGKGMVKTITRRIKNLNCFGLREHCNMPWFKKLKDAVVIAINNDYYYVRVEKMYG